MREIETGTTPNNQRALVRLLRFIGAAPARVTERGDHLEIATGRADHPRRFDRQLVEQGVSAGLLLLEGGSLCAEPATASSFLRRAMVKEHEEIFQEQHRLCNVVSIEIDGARHAVRRNDLSSPLSALLRLKDRDGSPFFPAGALEAGERLAADFHRGHLNPRITASWEPRVAQRSKGQGNGAQDISDTAMAARMRFSKAADAMGPELSGVAIDVCCFEKGLELVERERQWPVRSAKLMLRTALQALSRHYAPPKPAGRARDSHHWGAEGYRPDL